MNQEKLFFIFAILLSIAFCLGYTIGYTSAISKCIEAGEKVLDIKLKDWVIPEVKARLGNVEVLNENTTVALDKKIF